MNLAKKPSWIARLLNYSGTQGKPTTPQPVVSSELSRPPVAEDYPRLFAEAVERSRRYGLFKEPFHPIDGRLIDAQRLEQIAYGAGDIAVRCFGGDPRGFAGQCFGVSLEFEKDLAKIIGKHKPIVTIGSYYMPNRRWFGHDLSYAEAHLRGEPVDVNFGELHAWLTLPSHEIVDLTLATTAAIAGGARPSNVGRLIADHPSNLSGVYEPQFVGHDIFEALGLKKLVPISIFTI